jgi:hypothetical protein
MPNFSSEASELLISRKALASRWQCSRETIKRRTREGLLHPVRFNQRFIRYPISEVIRIEHEASGRAPIFGKLRQSPKVGLQQFLASQTENEK